MYFSDNKIAINAGCSSDTIKHEMGHAMDYIYLKIKKTRLSEVKLGNSSVIEYYNTYKNNANYRYSYLRDYSYTNHREFWADLFAYDEKNLHIDNSLKSIRKKALDEYNKMYKENKSEWNKIKESYK